MIIPDDILKKWEKIRSHGDITDMAKGNASLRTIISNAVNGKPCNEEVFIILRDFYKKREQLLATA